MNVDIMPCVKISARLANIEVEKGCRAKRKEAKRMWQKQNKNGYGKWNKRLISVLIGFFLVGVLLVGCGASSATRATNSASIGNYAQNPVNHSNVSTQGQA